MPSTVSRYLARARLRSPRHAPFTVITATPAVLPGVKCAHEPACPPAGAVDWWAARNITAHPGQGWTLLCNGALVFDDHGALLPDGRITAISPSPPGPPRPFPPSPRAGRGTTDTTTANRAAGQPHFTKETSMHPTLGYYLARARVALIVGALSLLAVGTLAARASAGASVRAASAGAVTFVPIVEPFDPGHPARTRPNPGNCYAKRSTAGIEQCLDTKTENTDARIDAAQRARFRRSTPAQDRAINTQDREWLAARVHVCQAAYHTGGSIDLIDVARCLLDESTARLHGVTGTRTPKAALPQTDMVDLSQLAYYTTAGGTRIAEIDSQGDQTGGGVVAWVIIGGYQGFTVHPSQFTYQDGSFTDAGIVQPPNPRGHRVAPGAVYEFSIDYSMIPHDPHVSKGTGGFVYTAGGRVLAQWAGR